MTFEINHRVTGAVLFSAPHQSSAWEAHLRAGGANLVGAVFHYANLQNLQIKRANFSDGDFTRAGFFRTEAQGCNFTGAKFTGASLMHVEFKNCNFTGVNFKNCDFTGAEFQNCNFTNATFGGAVFDYSSWKNCTTTGADFTGAICYRVPIKFAPVSITGMRYPITIMGDSIQIGCQFHTVEAWEKFSTRDIFHMDGRNAVVWWCRNKGKLLAMARELGKA